MSRWADEHVVSQWTSLQAEERSWVPVNSPTYDSLKYWRKSEYRVLSALFKEDMRRLRQNWLDKHAYAHEVIMLHSLHIKWHSSILLTWRCTLSGHVFQIKAFEMNFEHCSTTVLRSDVSTNLSCFSCKSVWSLRSEFCWARSFLEQTPTENASSFQIKGFRAKSKLTEKLYTLDDSGSVWIASLAHLYRSRNSCKQYHPKIITSKT